MGVIINNWGHIITFWGRGFIGGDYHYLGARLLATYDYGDFDGDDGDGDHDDPDDDLDRLTFPDWLVVKHLGECMEKDNFADLINMMANNLDDVDVDEEKVMVVMMRRRMMRMSMSLT